MAALLPHSHHSHAPARLSGLTCIAHVSSIESVTVGGESLPVVVFSTVRFEETTDSAGHTNKFVIRKTGRKTETLRASDDTAVREVTEPGHPPIKQTVSLKFGDLARMFAYVKAHPVDQKESVVGHEVILGYPCRIVKTVSTYEGSTSEVLEWRPTNVQIDELTWEGGLQRYTFDLDESGPHLASGWRFEDLKLVKMGGSAFRHRARR